MDATSVLSKHLLTAPFAARVQELNGEFAAMPEGFVEQILDSAESFCREHLEPLNADAERQGPQLIDGRVKMPDRHASVWQAFLDGGFSQLDASAEWGGMGMPSSLAIAVQELMDSVCPAFGMMPVPQRAASRLIDRWAADELRQEWMPKLTTGAWAATICISEPDAGSDVRRIRTRARKDGQGKWCVSGEKCWISFGDQDLTPRIGHCLLAKTEADDGRDQISLFLVPDRFGENGNARRNNIVVRRIEEKLGFHLSPTCALGFEEAEAILLGEQGRGLAQLFVMIGPMRLATAVQGAGIAGRAYDCAYGYSLERRQGGRGKQLVAIIEHADVRRMLLDMAGRLETLRGLNQAIANLSDIERQSEDGDERHRAGALLQWLLPIAKTLGGEVGFANASDAIQVLGGAGYTTEWPVEQCLRDARVLTIFEGTTGMQAQDLVRRRLLGSDRSGYEAFFDLAREEASQHDELAKCLDHLEAAANWLASSDRNEADIDASSTSFLQLASLAACGWIAARLAGQSEEDNASRHLAAAGRHYLTNLEHKTAEKLAIIISGARQVENFGEIG